MRRGVQSSSCRRGGRLRCEICRTGVAIVERMFEGVSDFDLIDVMGEATRDESTAIAQRLASVAELFVRRCGELAQCGWWCADEV